MAESSSLLRAPLGYWSGRCFITRPFRGLGEGVGSTVVVGVDCVGSGVGSGTGVVDAERKLGVEVAVVATVVVGVDCVGSGVGSGLGVVDTERILGVEVADVAMVVVRVDCIGGASKIVFSRPYTEAKITIREAPVINLCFSIRYGSHGPVEPARGRQPHGFVAVNENIDLDLAAGPRDIVERAVRQIHGEVAIRDPYQYVAYGLHADFSFCRSHYSYPR